MVTALEKAENEVRSVKVIIVYCEGKLAGNVAVAITEVQCEGLIARAEGAQARENELYDKIVGLAPPDMDPYDAEHLDLVDRIDAVLAGLKVILKEFVIVPGPIPPPRKPAADNIRLPRLALPTFDGNIQNWVSFKDQFLAAVHNNGQISDAQKLNYLKSCLSGEAAALIKKYAITDDNYQPACDQLEARYQDDRKLLFTALSRFVKQPTLPGNSAESVKTLIDVSTECITSIESLALPVGKADSILLYLMYTKLDDTSRQMWEHSLTGTDIPPLASLTEFLEKRARALGSEGTSQEKQKHPPRDGKPGFGNPKKVAHVHHVQDTQSCKLCGKNHPVFRCQQFIAMTVTQRSEQVKRNGLCFNCLGSGHSIAKCPSTRTCKTCKGKHNSLLHREKPTDPPADPVVALHSSDKLPGHALLATAMVFVQDQHGQNHVCRALLDGGSSSTFITESCVRKLKLPRSRVSAEIVGLAATAVGTAKGSASLKIISRTTGNSSYTVEALVFPKVTARLPIHKWDPTLWPHLNGLELADPKFYQPDSIDILLGADIFYNILMNDSRTGPPGSPIAVKTTLGWLVAGQIGTPTKEVLVHYSDVDMEKQLEKLWEIDTVSTTRAMTKEEKDCEAHFQSTHSVSKQGRFTVQLPLRNPQPQLGFSRDIAVRRLKQLEARFAKVPERHLEYCDFMTAYETLGHMEEIPASEILSPMLPICYIPHHFILKDENNAVKFRVVFDASAKTSSGVALNDALMVGPTIQDKLTDILMRFRLHPVAFVADIEKMYRQIRVNKPDCDLQRIVWRESASEPIKDYRLLTVTYGTASAPFLATKALQQLAINNRDSLPLASKAALESMYVDDLMSGERTIEQAIETINQLRELMRRGGMELRKWESNCPKVREAIPEEFRATKSLLSLDMDLSVKALGIYWDPQTDTCNFKVKLDPDGEYSPITKRMILSETSRIFDPLGWCAPVIIRAKILIQKLWSLELGWDEPVPDLVRQEWIAFKKNLMLLEHLSIPRCVFPSGYTTISLVGFCDASEKAYAAVVYFCAHHEQNPPLISLVTSKTRVAPSKVVSLPRLELCGALLLSQLIRSVQQNLQVHPDQLTVFTDSTVVLAWINSQSTRWKTFVANRVSEIQDRVPARHWKHVKGVENPADCASRGIDPSELKEHPLWWQGPAWVQETEQQENPTSDSVPDFSTAVDEEKKTLVCALAVPPEDSLLYKYSSLSKLKRVTAYIWRFYSNCFISIQRKKGIFPTLLLQLGPLTSIELNSALSLWVRIIQAEQFSREINCLQQKLPVSPKSSVHALNPFLDSSNILRVGGRLRNAPLPRDQRQPMLLPRHHFFTNLLIRSEHEKYLHAGPQLLLSIIHRSFWIIRARDAIRHEIRKCVVCTRLKAETLQQFMGDFPAARVTPARPFLKCGVDYAGPFLVKPISPRSKITIKAYLAVFVCFTTHAFHLEVVSELSTAAFIAAFHRFISRRGKPSDMYSDCGTNFVGANKEIREVTALLNDRLHNERLATKLCDEGIQWHFNPPGAPHFGGLWEAGVKSAKYHLKRVIGLTRLTFEEITTVVAQVEACLNSRPLTPVSTDPEDLTALTPGHFLIGAPLTSLPEPDLTAENTGRLSRWQHLQQIHQHFWHRWSNEFIARLQQRPKWLQMRNDLKVGDMVIIKHDSLPPLKWQLGRVKELHPGDDGLVRVITLWTATGEINRSITKVCLLPIETHHITSEQTPAK